jgi:alpha-1,2-glucosyltransferase
MLRARRVPAQVGSKHGKSATERLPENDPTITLDANTAFNITLFPPLFFFSALFYTDVMSTLAVLLSYSTLLKKRTASGSVIDNVNALLVGVVALLFRQTNIFWVAVFPAGITVVEALKANAPSSERTQPMATGEILQNSWSTGAIYDCPVQDAVLRGASYLTTTSKICADVHKIISC